MLGHIVEFIGYALVVVFWLAILLAGRAAFRGIRAGRFSRAIGFGAMVVALLWLGLYVGLTPGSSAYARYRDAYSYFGRGFVLSSPILSYNSPRAFNGDGYSIQVFKISETLSSWASSPPPEFLANYPVKPSYRSHWSSVPWRPTPVAVDERRFLEFALEEQAGDDDLIAAKKLLRRLANEPGNYLACFYFMHGELVGDVDFFLISPCEHIFIRVNFNT